HAAADNPLHVEFPQGVRGQVRRRILDVAARRAARAGFGDDAAYGAVAIETKGDVFEVFVRAAQQQRPGQSPPERGRGRGRGLVPVASLGDEVGRHRRDQANRGVSGGGLNQMIFSIFQFRMLRVSLNPYNLAYPRDPRGSFCSTPDWSSLS